MEGGLPLFVLAYLVVYPVSLRSTLLHHGYSQWIGVDCTHKITSHIPSDSDMSSIPRRQTVTLCSNDNNSNNDNCSIAMFHFMK